MAESFARGGHLVAADTRCLAVLFVSLGCSVAVYISSLQYTYIQEHSAERPSLCSTPPRQNPHNLDPNPEGDPALSQPAVQQLRTSRAKSGVYCLGLSVLGFIAFRV